MQWFRDKKQYFLIGFAVVVLVIIFFVQTEKGNSKDFDIQDFQLDSPLAENIESSIPDEEFQEIPVVVLKVDVKGAVSLPGVYEANEWDRIIDIVGKAGGFLEDADQSKVNLSKKVADEMVIYVPKIGEEITEEFNLGANMNGTSSPNGNGEPGKVNINTADATQLQSLVGVGPQKALAIIDFREKNGPFQKPEDLMKISGIGEKTFEKLKEQITVK